MKKRWGSFVSGGGTTMDYIADQIEKGAFEGYGDGLEAAIVIANKQCKALGVAAKRKIRSVLLERSNPQFRDANGKFSEALRGREQRKILIEEGVDIAIGNGYDQMVDPAAIVKNPKDKTLQPHNIDFFNQHPQLVPEFGGKKMVGSVAHDTVLRYRKLSKQPLDRSVVIAQRMDPDAYDAGAILEFGYVEIDDNDTAETFKDRALPVEYLVQVRLIRNWLRGNLRPKRPSDVFGSFGYDPVLLERAKREAIEADAATSH
jgi:folate-dependent phosphoribosylglycinamide formyltransferase PurN